jgi:RpiB/LacA/LacB family sugar-phosphate isomerase
MNLYIASDRHGWILKNKIINHLKENNHTYMLYDLCEKHDEISDPTSYAFFVAQIVNDDPRNLGILVCKTGNEMLVPANRVKFTRACMALSVEMAKIAKQNINSNILVIPSDISLFDETERIVDSYLETKYDENMNNFRYNTLLDMF